MIYLFAYLLSCTLSYPSLYCKMPSSTPCTHIAALLTHPLLPNSVALLILLFCLLYFYHNYYYFYDFFATVFFALSPASIIFTIPTNNFYTIYCLTMTTITFMMILLLLFIAYCCYFCPFSKLI